MTTTTNRQRPSPLSLTQSASLLHRPLVFQQHRQRGLTTTTTTDDVPPPPPPPSMTTTTRPPLPQSSSLSPHPPLSPTLSPMRHDDRGNGDTTHLPLLLWEAKGEAGGRRLPAMASGGGGRRVQWRWERRCYYFFVMLNLLTSRQAGGSLANLRSIQHEECT